MTTNRLIATRGEFLELEFYFHRGSLDFRNMVTVLHLLKQNVFILTQQ